MRKGRPKNIDIAANRVHSIVLDIEGERIFRKVCQNRKDTKWFNEYINQHLKEDFKKVHALELLLQELKEASLIRDKAEDQMRKIAREMNRLKLKKEEIKAKKDTEKSILARE